jgi:hypothetical protein
MDVNGYEVEGERGNFVCAFSTPVAAIQFALKLQVRYGSLWNIQ